MYAWRQRGYFRITTLSVAFLLVFSFGLHTIEIEHEHPYHSASHHERASHGEETAALSVYLHAGDRKALLALPPLELSHAFLVSYAPSVEGVAYRESAGRSVVCTDHLRECLSDGILNTKVYRV